MDKKSVQRLNEIVFIAQIHKTTCTDNNIIFLY